MASNPQTLQDLPKKLEKKLSKISKISLKSLQNHESGNIECRDIASVPGSNSLIFFLDGELIRRYEFEGAAEAPVVYRGSSDRHLKAIFHMSARNGILPDWQSSSGEGCGSLICLETPGKDNSGQCFLVATRWNGILWEESGRLVIGTTTPQAAITYLVIKRRIFKIKIL